MSIQNDKKTALLSDVESGDSFEQEKTFLCLKGENAQTVYVGVLIAIWWSLCIGYNVYNKYTLIYCRLPWIVSVIQMFVGIPVNGFYWMSGLRSVPKLTSKDILKLSPIAFCHLGTHVSAVIGLGAGAVSFMQIIKTFEPVLAALFAGLMLGKFFSWQIYSCLIPIIGGVAYSAMKGDIGFGMVAFVGAMASNTFSALRGVTGKKVMGPGNAFQPEQNMHAANLFGVLTFIATFMLLPFSLIVEWTSAADKWADRPEGITDGKVILYTLLSGLFYYFYNEVAFLVLDNVHPVTHAVSNTLKRVAIIISAIFIFNTPMSLEGYIGSTIAVGGTLLYAMATKTYKTTYVCSCVPETK